MLNHGQPAALDLLIELGLIHVVERQLLILVFLARDDAAGVSVDEGRLALGAAALQLPVKTALPFARAVIIDLVLHVHDVFAALEGINFGFGVVLFVGSVFWFFVFVCFVCVLVVGL